MMEKTQQLNLQFTKKEAFELRDEIIWKKLSQITIYEAVQHFLFTLTSHTYRAYECSFRIIFMKRIIDESLSLQSLSLMNLETIVDDIKNKIDGSLATKQVRCAAFISFTGFLHRRTKGLIRKALPNNDKNMKTFPKIRDIAATNALTDKQWFIFIDNLRKVSTRYYLIAKMTLQGIKRIDEVLSATIEQISWNKNQIIFTQLKSDIKEKSTFITYPQNFMDELKEFIGEREKGYIFLSIHGKKMRQDQVYRMFVRASRKLPIKVTPHVLRTTGITLLLNRGYSTEQILKLSGHTDSRYIVYYDKTPYEQNISQEVCLI